MKTVTEILNKLNRVKDLKEVISNLKTENKKAKDVIETLNSFDPSDYKYRAIDEMVALIDINCKYIAEYEDKLKTIADRATELYDSERDYKDELKKDAVCTFETMCINATSDLKAGRSIDAFNRQITHAQEWLNQRMICIEQVTDNTDAFITMINMGLGDLT